MNHGNRTTTRKPKSSHCFQSLVLVLLGVILPPSARSDSTNWYWEFDQPLFVVGPSDSVVIAATLFNDVSAADSFTITAVGGSFTGDLYHFYQVALGNTDNPSEFANQLLGHTLTPGESLNYVLGRLTPLDGFVEPGVYDRYEASLYLNGNLRPPRNSFQIVVVPEPTILSFLGVASTGTLLFFRWRQRLWRVANHQVISAELVRREPSIMRRTC